MSKISNDQPPKRVKVTLACTLCRKKKVKCDGIQPSCSRCKSIGNSCQYSEPPKKRGPPKGYVEVIENRAHRIESLLGNQQQQQQHHHFDINNNVNSFAHVSVDKNIIQPNNNFTVKEKQQKTVNPLLCLIAGAVNNVKSDNIIHGSHGIMYDFLVTSNVLNIEQDNKKHISDIIISDNFTWTENFFNQFNFMFPILSRPQFTFQLGNGELNPLLKLAVFTLGCRLENNHDQNEKEKLLYKQFLISHDLLLVPDLYTIQAIAIMCWYTYIIGDVQNCYSLRHQLSQLINKSNFGYESDNNNNDIHFNEMKRRSFWVSFVIDQWLASCTGGERMLVSPTNQPWDCKWPQLEDNQLFALHYQQQPAFINNTSYFSIESALQINSFTEMIRLSKIVADMCTGNNTIHLESKLTEWLLHLPSYLDYGKSTNEPNKEPSPIAKIYRILYYTVQIMLNNSNNKNGIITSICTTAANTIIHISEQMVEKGQQKYLYNVFFLSLTLATSIYLDNTIENFESASDKMSLHKSISMIKDVNCTLLSPTDFESIMDQFLTERCRILSNNNINITATVYPSPTNSTTILSTNNNRKNSNNKRMYQDDEDDCQSILFMNSPSSLNSSLSVVDYSAKPPFELKEEFDLNDLLFPNIMDPLSTDNLEWIFENQHTMLESSTTTTTSSNITPSNSPSISLYPKDENNSSIELLSNQHFFNSFPLL